MLSEIEYHDEIGPSSLDPFTPHRRVISLGGIKVHEGAWTSVEALKRLAKNQSLHDGVGVGVIEERGRFFAQLNSLRLSIETSVVGMSVVTLAIIWIDARYKAEWIERSAERAIDELRIWRWAREQIGAREPLEVLIWVEEGNGEHERLNLDRSLGQALSKVELACQRSQVTILSVIKKDSHVAQTEDSCIHLWAQFQHALSSDQMLLRAEDESRYVEISPYIDELVLIPAGQFYQGGSDLSPKSERPRHRIKISQALWVTQCVITEECWRAVMGESNSSEPQAMLPKSEINWFDALRFCNRLSELSGLDSAYEIEEHHLPKVIWKRGSQGFRLLTESEWEYVCTAGSRSSLTAPVRSLVLGWTEQRSQLKAHPVAQLDPNSWGLYDCLGNVAEWCQDVYRADVYASRQGQYLVVDPCESQGDDGERVIRGGSFDLPEYKVTPSFRDHCRPQQAWSTIGFRVARPHTF